MQQQQVLNFIANLIITYLQTVNNSQIDAILNFPVQSSDKSKEGEGARQDLRSRGLCLVPIESTYPVASETTADFWTPTFGGSYR